MNISSTSSFAKLNVKAKGTNPYEGINVRSSALDSIYAYITHNGTKALIGSSGIQNNAAAYTPLSLQTSEVDRLTISTVGESTFSGKVNVFPNQIIGTYADVAAGGTGAGTAALPSYAFYNMTAMGMYPVGTNTIGFSTAATNRLTITSEGQVYMNTTSSIGTGVLSIKLGGTNKLLGIRFRAAAAGNFATAYENSSGTIVGKIIMNASSTSYETASDYRLKENVTPITDAISRINQLKPSRFNFIADADKIVDGFIAHEVQDIVPEAISGTKDALNEDGTPDYQGIDQSKIVPLLTAAIKEQQTIIEDLKARIEKLEL